MMYSLAPAVIARVMCSTSFSVVQKITFGDVAAPLLAQRDEKGDAVHHRHVPVEQHGVGHRHAALLERVAPVLGFRRREAKLLEDAPRHLADDGAVVDHQAMFHAFRSFTSRLERRR